MDKTITTLKHIKIQEDDDNESVLLHGLPNHLAQLCLSSLQPSLLYGVCRSWRRLIYASSFPPFHCLYALCSPTSSSSMVSNTKVEQNSVEVFSFDPISSTWTPLQSPPSDPPLHFLHRHPSFISRTIPIQSLTVKQRLVLIAATTHKFLPALERPLGFDPLLNEWFLGPPLPTPRRWCATGSVDGEVYVASGVGSVYHGDVARSLEKWDVKKKVTEWKWKMIAGLRDGRFSREAIDAIGYRGKLCMVNVKGNAVKQGAVYNVSNDWWEDMPEGMLAGWNGPAASAIEDETEMYVVDEAKGTLSRYVPEIDQWEVLVESSEHLIGAEQITAGRGRVCAVCGGRRRIVVVDVAVTPVEIRSVMNSPAKMEVIALHILPRISY